MKLNNPMQQRGRSLSDVFDATLIWLRNPSPKMENQATNKGHAFATTFEAAFLSSKSAIVRELDIEIEASRTEPFFPSAKASRAFLSKTALPSHQ
ncbi:hypothetical protein [Brucella sp. LJL56]